MPVAWPEIQPDPKFRAIVCAPARAIPLEGGAAMFLLASRVELGPTVPKPRKRGVA